MSTAPLISFPVQLLATAVLLGFLGWVVYLIRYRELSLRDSLLWLLSTLATLVVTVYPRLLEHAAHAIGVAVPANALFAAAFVYFALNLLSCTLALSSQASRIRRLTQECAIMRAEIDQLRRGERG